MIGYKSRADFQDIPPRPRASRNPHTMSVVSLGRHRTSTSLLTMILAGGGGNGIPGSSSSLSLTDLASLVTAVSMICVIEFGSLGPLTIFSCIKPLFCGPRAASSRFSLEPKRRAFSQFGVARETMGRKLRKQVAIKYIDGSIMLQLYSGTANPDFCQSYARPKF